MIAIIDYGLGNIKAIANVYKQLNIVHKVARTIDDLQDSSKLILPGVGAFDHAMKQLEKSGLRDSLDDMVLRKKVPVIGICVGMQMLAQTSEEGSLPGLGWLDATVKKFDTAKLKQRTRLPHMGWNDVVPVVNHRLFHGLENDACFYFLHSYYFHCNNFYDSIATSYYGDSFTCAVNGKNVFGVQFHPEKSHEYGIKLLKNFAEI